MTDTTTEVTAAPLAREAYDALAAAANLARDVLIAHDAWELHYEGGWEEISEKGVHAWWATSRDGGASLGEAVGEWVALARTHLTEAMLTRPAETVEERGQAAIRARINRHYLLRQPAKFADAVISAIEEATEAAYEMGHDHLDDAIQGAYVAAGAVMLAEAEVRAERHRALRAARARRIRKG